MKTYKHHIVKNFKKDTPIFKKIFANIIFLIGVTKITWRKNNLTPQDYKNALKIIRKGDIILLGSRRRTSSLFIRGKVIHSSIYVGSGKVIHAISDGVIITKFRDFFSEYDNLAILRPKIKKNKKATIKKVVKYMQEQVGKPYDFFFSSGQQEFFCSQIVNEAYLNSRFNTGLKNHKKPKNIIGKKIKLLEITRALHPEEFFNENFDVVFLSESFKRDK